MRANVKMIALATAVAALAAAQPATATTTRMQAPTVALHGSVLPSVAHSALVGRTSPAAAVRVSLVLQPAHAALLARLASHSSGRPGLSQRVMNGLFRPNPFARAQVAAYMLAHGFRSAGNGMLTMSFTGDAAQAEQAFGVSLNHYKLADGTGYRAPSGAIHLPPALAARVITVTGLSTLPMMRPLGLHKVHHKAGGLKPQISPGPPCPNATGAATGGSLLPAQLASANGYNVSPLWTSNDDGTGESVALVEFSDYVNADISQYKTCFALTTPVTRVKVNGGTAIDHSGGDIEVALDQQILASMAPGLNHIYTFIAPQSTSMAGILDSIYSHHTSQGVHIVSDSWGNCELALLEADQAATNRELQLMAVAGMSFYAASGDDGASDCHRSLGFNGPEVDDPAVQPYATGVGGTNLDVSSGHTERVWGSHSAANGAGGGGVSLTFTMPSWQKGMGVIRTGQSSKTKCGGKTRYCREVPDVAFDADPDTGYVVNCVDCGGWSIVGGTSGAAPLMAAFTADANHFSLRSGGQRMGFADPFLYHEFAADPSMFHDITNGSNSILSNSTYTASAGYDLASGLGSVDVQQMATDLSNYTRSAVHIHGTRITASASVNPVTAGHPTILSGTLTDTTSHTALGGRVVWIEGFIGQSSQPVFLRLHTGRKGGWAKKLTKTQLGHKFVWHAVYVGEQGHHPAISPGHTLKVG